MLVYTLPLFVLSMTLALDLTRRSRSVPLAAWSLIGMGLVYGLAWPLIAEASEGYTISGNFNPEVFHIIFESKRYYPYQSICALIAIVSLYIGYLITPSGKRIKMGVIHSKKLPNNFILTAFILLGLSIVSQILYTNAYGGIIEQLEFSRHIRAGIFVVDNPFSFLKPFGMVSIFASIFFFVSILCRIRLWMTIPGLIASFAFACLVLYSAQGRVTMVLYIGTFALTLFILATRSKMRLAIFAPFGIILSVLMLHYLSIALDLKPAPSIGAFLARELAFPFGSFFANIRSDIELRWFIDVLLVPFYFIPTSLQPEFVTDVEQVNTIIVSGAPKGVGGVTGSVPVDVITFGYMQMFFPGVFLAGALFGAILKVGQRSMERLQNRVLFASISAYVSLRFGFLATFYFYPSNIIEGGFPFFVSILTLYVLSRLPNFTIGSGVPRRRLRRANGH